MEPTTTWQRHPGHGICHASSGSETQRAQHGLIEEYTPNHIRDPYRLQGILLMKAYGALREKGLPQRAWMLGGLSTNHNWTCNSSYNPN